MKLQDRDILIINYIEEFGATIQQVADLYFNSSYDAAKKRLKKLQDNKFFKGALHPVLNKKVYYKRKVPSFHSLVIQSIYIKNRNIIQSYKREAKLDKYTVDALLITKKNNVIVLEVDIYNKTKKEKLEYVNNYIKTKLGSYPTLMVINRKNLDNEIAISFPTE